VILEIVAGVVVLVALGTLASSVRILREYQRVVLFRLGRAVGTRGPGLVLVNPITDRTTSVDLREQFLEIPAQVAITQDNASISIDFIIFYKVVDPESSVVAVQDFAAAAQNIAATTLRSVVGDMMLDDVLSKRDQMNASLRLRLDEVTERWGVKVTAVEVREVKPPAGVLDAMTRQMSAERTRRAAITEAQGQKQASITLAEGTKQAAILQAEGERQATILRAEGLAAALRALSAVTEQLDPTTIQVQYLRTLEAIGASPSSTVVVPMELAGLLAGLGSVRAAMDHGGGSPSACPPPETVPAPTTGPVPEAPADGRVA